MEYGCIGEHLPHSFSKEIHEQIESYDYRLQEIRPEDLDAFMKARDFKAINVTIPYKQAVIPYLDEISENARAIGAVNTIVNKDGKLCGYNTDFGGMRALIARMGLELKGRKVLILGTGGTSKTACAVAESLWAREIYRASRSGKEGALSYEDIYKLHSDAEILINTTPCGMFPDPSGMPIDPELFPNLEGVLDAIYNPLASRLVLKARQMEVPAEGGLYMLVAQAVLAAEHFTGKKYDPRIIDRIYLNIFTRKQNIVLVGMPCCGKSTISKLLAEQLGMDWVDTDDVVVEKRGMEIPDIFARYGEPYFRDLETEVIRELASRSGCIIATGGGTVLREQNIDALRQNGRVYFIDRPLEQLLPTKDRPLANSEEKIRKIYAQRYERYCSVADVVVSSVGDAQKVAAKIKALHTHRGRIEDAGVHARRFIE